MQNLKINKKEFLEYTEKNIKKQLESADQRIIYLSQIANKLPETINELSEQLRIITDRRYPTLDSLVSIKEYCTFIYEEEKKEVLLKTEANKNKINEIINSNIGISFSKEEKIIIKKISKNILELIETKENILEAVEELFNKNYKNFKEIATTKIACKMLEIAGSFERLASMPSSTIQLLGSEKTFFLALRKHKKTPKYGVIYNHPSMINLSTRNKGRFARSLASKISIAIKADINKVDITDQLKKKLEQKIKNYK